MKRRIIALLLTLAMSISLLSFGAWAAEAEVPEEGGEAVTGEEHSAFAGEALEAAAERIDEKRAEAAPDDSAEPYEAPELPECELDESVTEEAALGDAGTVYSELNPAVQLVRDQMKARDAIITLSAEESVGTALFNQCDNLVFAPTNDPCEGDYLRAAVSKYRLSSLTAGGVSTLTIEVTYNDTAALEADATEVVNRLADELSLKDPNTSNLQKVINIYQWLTANVTYNKEAASANPRQAHSAFSGAGALVNKSAVCQGYPAAMYRLLKVAGIESRMITSDQLDHAWLIARLGSKWSLFDPTWDGGYRPGQWKWFNKGKADFVRHDNSDDNFHRDPTFVQEHPLKADETDLLTDSLGEAPRFTLITHDRGSLSTVAENGRTKVLVFINGSQDCIDLIQSLNDKRYPGVDIYYVNLVQSHADQQSFIMAAGSAYYPIDKNPGRYVACANAIDALNAFCQTTEIDTSVGYSFPMTFVVDSGNRIIFGGYWFPASFDEYIQDAGLLNNSAPASAEPVYYPGAQEVALAGDNAVWHFYEGGTLRITGAGALWPNIWNPTRIGWIDDITFTASWSNDEINACDIKQIIIGPDITELGDNLFINCSNLETVTFTGDAPTLGQELTSHAVTVRYPADNATWYGVSDGNSFYTGTVWESVGDEPDPVSVESASVTVSPMTYNGAPQTASVTVTLDGTPLVPGTDFTVSNATQTNAGRYTLTITGKGNYTGSKSVDFTIARASLSKAVLTLSATGYSYNGTAKKPSVKVVSSGKTLKNGTDYSLSYTNNRIPGKATATVTGKGNYCGTKAASFTIKKGTFSVVSTALVVKGRTVTLKVTGGAKITYRTGNAKIATVTSKGVVKGIAPGKVTITVTDTGNGCYNKAAKQVTVTVTPPAPSNVSVKNSKARTTTVAWTKMSGITGYELQASTDKAFKTNVKKTTARSSAASAVFLSLTRNRTWYFRVRCYKTVSGKKYHSSWSALKALKVTK